MQISTETEICQSVAETNVYAHTQANFQACPLVEQVLALCTRLRKGRVATLATAQKTEAGSCVPCAWSREPKTLYPKNKTLGKANVDVDVVENVDKVWVLWVFKSQDCFILLLAPN